MLDVPLAPGVKVTKHVPADKVHDAAGVKVPAAPVAVKLTVPAGVLVVPPEVSETLAVQVEP